MRPTFGPRVPCSSFLTSVCLTAAALLLATGAPAAAQTTGTITGRVTDSRTEQPVAGATIEITGTRLVVSAGDDGRYRISNVPLGAQTISARRLGYAILRKPVTVSAGDATVDFALQTSVVSLDEVVVTGTTGREQLRAIGNAVSTVNAPEVLQQSAAPNLGSLLAARSPGVVLSTGTGRIGAGPAINIRGRSSIGLGNSPLIYIDGVRVNNTTSTGTAGNGGFSSQGASVAGRLNDIIPEDIERIEIIKGPAASTIYGTEASNGVIQIITKKGASGARPSLSLQVQEGSAFFRDAENRMPTNYVKVGTDIIPWNAVKQERQRGTPMFRTGETRLINGSVSGNRNDLRYYFSSAFNDEKGIEPNNSLKQLSTHANLGVAITPQLDITTSLNYVDLRSHLGTDYGASAMYGALFGHASLYTGSRGFAAGFAPEISQRYWDNSQDVKRMTASSTVSHTPFDWLRQRLIVGADFSGDDSRGLEKFIPAPLNSMVSATTAGGRIGQTIRSNTGITGDYAATATAQLRSQLQAATSVGAQYYRNEQSASFLGGFGFPGEGIETVSGAANPIAASQSDQVNTTLGVFAQEKFNWRERLFLTGAVRVDNNSAFGEDLKWVTYPKFDVAWVVSEEPFFKWTNVLSSLRLRAAYGESGRQPNTFSALRTFQAVQGPSNANAVTPGNIGNADLRPERGKELEAGFEAALFDRVNFDFTYFNKKTTDLIVNQAIAPSSGFPGNRPVNLGRVDNKGLEIAATAKVVERQNFAWDLSATLATNKDVVRSLGGVPSLITTFGQANAVGYPINGLFSRRVVSATLDANGVATNVLCDPGNGGAGVPCLTAPFVFIGTPTPKASGAITNSIAIGRSLRFYGMLDFKRGHKVWNVNELLRCTGLAGAPFCDANYHPQNYSPLYIAEAVGTAYTRDGTIDQYYQDGSFMKLRELSMTYILPQRLTVGAQSASITIAGRELHTWTDYRGLDPEGNSASAAGATTLDQANIPPLTRFTVTFNVRF